MAKGIVSSLIALAVIAATGSMRCVAQSDQDVIRVTGPVRQIPSVQGIPVPPKDGSTEPYKTGLLSPKDAEKLLETLVGVDKAKMTTIIHLLRWSDAEHTTVLFQKWYLYDPHPSKTSFYLQSEQQGFERTAIPGRKELQFVYIHLNHNLENPPNEREWEPYSQIDPNNPQPVIWPSSSTTNVNSIHVAASRRVATVVTLGQNGFAKNQEICLSWPKFKKTQTAGTICGRVSTIIDSTTLQLSTSNALPDLNVLNCTNTCKAIPRIPTLKNPISYTITVTKEKTQFVQDLQTVLQILGVTVPAAGAIEAEKQPAVPPPGYYSVSTFQSRWSTSSIGIAASLNGNSKSPPAPAGSTTPGATANQLASATYHNEKPAWIGLSAGIPITTYKDVVFQTSSGTLVPQSITQQKAYVFLDGYIPPVLPSLVSFRYIPHPFVGFPLKGEVFRHVMVGGGVGVHWLEPFGGVVLTRKTTRRQPVRRQKRN
jgi:hypothetical protein